MPAAPRSGSFSSSRPPSSASAGSVLRSGATVLVERGEDGLRVAARILIAP